MKPTVVVRPQAAADIDEHAEFIAHRRFQSGLQFYDAVETALDFLISQPNLGSPCEFRNPAAAGLRMWPIRGYENHVIFYRHDETRLEIVRVLHGARNLEGLF